MSFLKGLFRGDPIKAAARHKRRAQAYQQSGNEKKAAEEWAAAGQSYVRVPDLLRALECYLQAAQFYLAIGDTYREESVLRTAINVALEGDEYDAAVPPIDQLQRIGTRQKNDQLLLFTHALKVLVLLAANDLTKAKENQREAEKIIKRLGRRKPKTRLYQITQALVSRFIDGAPFPSDAPFPQQADESEAIERIVKRLTTIYQNSGDSELVITLDKTEAKIKERVTGRYTLSSSIPLRILQAQIQLPSNIALVEKPEVTDQMETRFNTSFIIEPNLPGNYDIGPAFALIEVEGQQFNLHSSPIPLVVAAAKPRIQLIAEPASEVFVGKEFELLLQIENLSHGDASDLTIAITLPPTLVLQTGTLEKRILSLPSQQNIQFPLFLVPSKSGNHEGRIHCQCKGASGRRQTTSAKFIIIAKPRPRKGKD